MKYYLAILWALLSLPSIASIPPGQWQCLAFDSKEQSYKGLGDTLKRAMQAAENSCKQSSRDKSCKTAQSYCEQGPLSLIEDRCVVSDGSGRTWNTTGPDACKSALSLCTEWQFLHGKTSNCSIKHF